ncbi:FGFR1 oncogene partner 2 [Pristimantis euphronides]
MLVLGIQQENRQIRELQQENKELRTSLEEHQSALELIMSKYREQMFRLLMASKKDDPGIIIKLKDQHSKVMKYDIFLIGRFSSLFVFLFLWQQENRGLREILQITRESFLNLRKEEAPESPSLSVLVHSSYHSLRKS